MNEKNEEKIRIAPVIRQMKVGETRHFPISKMMVVRSTCWTLRALQNIETKTHSNLNKKTIEVTRIQ